MPQNKPSFLAFFLLWADRVGWIVPDIHVIACDWLEHRKDDAVLRCFRGFGKSSILDIYNAWRLTYEPTSLILHQGSTDPDAYKVSRGTELVLEQHPWCEHRRKVRGETQRWWVNGSTDVRYGSMYCRGVMSTVTGHRATEIQNDDVEVPQNIATPEAREKLRARLSEQTHIALPGCRTLFVGTPHTHDSLYDEQEKAGADCLTIKMFEHHRRIETCDRKQYQMDFTPVFVFSGIGKQARLLKEEEDYTLGDACIVFIDPDNTLIDCYGQSAWPERFNKDELTKRRKKTRTVNEWDSQYQLESKPITDVRLDPDKMVLYDCEPDIQRINGENIMKLGDARIVGAVARWDCALGKINSDASVLSLVLTDNDGNLYWHCAQELTGELDSQCEQIRDLVLLYNIPCVEVEVNGPGGFVPPILRKHLKGTGCAVREQSSTTNKQKRILDAFEAPLSCQSMWAHVRVIDGPAFNQMREFNPEIKNQADDYIDSAAGAIAATPVRVKQLVKKLTSDSVENWRPNAGVFEVKTAY